MIGTEGLGENLSIKLPEKNIFCEITPKIFCKINKNLGVIRVASSINNVFKKVICIFTIMQNQLKVDYGKGLNQVSLLPLLLGEWGMYKTHTVW